MEYDKEWERDKNKAIRSSGLVFHATLSLKEQG